MIERNGKELIWPTGNVEAVRLSIAIDDVVKIIAIGKPKPIVERRARFISEFLVTSRGSFIVGFAQPICEQAERIVPKRVDLDGLSAARCNNPVAHFRIHPGKLVAFLTLREQAVIRIDMNIEPSAADMMLGDVDQRRQK